MPITLQPTPNYYGCAAHALTVDVGIIMQVAHWRISGGMPPPLAASALLKCRLTLATA